MLALQRQLVQLSQGSGVVNPQERALSDKVAALEALAKRERVSGARWLR